MKVHATATPSHNLAKPYRFDATPWFDDSDDDDIIEAINNPDSRDQIAVYLENYDDTLHHLLAAIELLNTLDSPGYTYTVDLDMAEVRAWLATNRPHLLGQIGDKIDTVS